MGKRQLFIVILPAQYFVKTAQYFVKTAQYFVKTAQYFVKTAQYFVKKRNYCTSTVFSGTWKCNNFSQTKL